MLGLRLPTTTMKLFGRSAKTPTELTKSLKDALQLMEMDKEKDRRRGSEEAAKLLTPIKVMLLGNEAHEPSPELGAQLVSEMLKLDVIKSLVINIYGLEFESRKEAVLIIGSLLRRQKTDGNYPVADYMAFHADLLDHLVYRYKYTEYCTAVGTILRDCIRHEACAERLLYGRSFEAFFALIEDKHFDVSADAFSTFKELLTQHHVITAQYLVKNFEYFFERYNKLLNSENYVAKRQSIRLLGELLINRFNYSAMVRYASNGENLKLAMNLLKDRSQAIQWEAFHVFKVFIATPEKSDAIVEILIRNKTRLLRFLENFFTEKDANDQFNDEKSFLYKQIETLPSQPISKVPVAMNTGRENELMMNSQQLSITKRLIDQQRAPG